MSVKPEEKSKPDLIAKVQYMYEDGTKEKWFHAAFFLVSYSVVLADIYSCTKRIGDFLNSFGCAEHCNSVFIKNFKRTKLNWS